MNKHHDSAIAPAHAPKTEAQKIDAAKNTPKHEESAPLGPHATLGRIVVYHDYGEAYAALVVKSDVENSTVDLTVFAPSHTFDRAKVTQSTDASPKTWSWPAKV